MSQSPALAPFTLAPATWRTRISEFFFAQEVPYGMAILRMLAPLALSGNLIRRWPWVRDIFSSDGAPAPLADNFGHFNMLPVFSGTVCVALYALMVLAMVTMAIGFRTRLSIILFGTLYWYFSIMDSVSTITKYSVILTHFFLLLALSNCGAVWSVDAWLARRKVRDPLACSLPKFPVWPARLVQLFLGVVYRGAAVTKLHTPVFFSGDQLMYWMMTHMMSYAPLGDLLSQYPLLLSVFGYITIIWEVAFIFCVWFPMLRLPMLAIGAIFHIMTAFTLGLLVFPVVMMSSYFAFMTEADVQWLAARFRKLQRRLPVLRTPFSVFGQLADRLLPAESRWGRPAVANAAFVVTAGLVVMAGVELQYRQDLYGERRPEGRYVLQPMDTERAEKLLAADQGLREKDKLMALDLGIWAAGDHLIDRRRQFQHGDRIIAQASLNPPREDLWVDCLLVDGDDRLITKVGAIAPRELFRSHFYFEMTPGLEPGPYSIVLKTSGQEVARRRFKLVGNPTGTVAAN
jgi:hypothetical protein